MPRVVRCGLIQARNVKSPAEAGLAEIREAMIEKHLGMIDEAGRRGVRILSLQELFYGPYFAAEQDTRWYQFTERVPEGPTVKLMQERARKHEMAMVVPVYEEEATGVYYNTAAVIDADGTYLGKYRKNHIPHCLPPYGRVYVKPGTSLTRLKPARDDRVTLLRPHFQREPACSPARAEIVLCPRQHPATPTTSGRSSRPRWPAPTLLRGHHNRVGREAPGLGEFYG